MQLVLCAPTACRDVDEDPFTFSRLTRRRGCTADIDDFFRDLCTWPDFFLYVMIQSNKSNHKQGGGFASSLQLLHPPKCKADACNFCKGSRRFISGINLPPYLEKAGLRYVVTYSVPPATSVPWLCPSSHLSLLNDRPGKRALAGAGW